MKKYLPETIFLTSFIIINVFPLGCFSSPPPSVPIMPGPTDPFPNPSNGFINGNDYINALQCIVNDRSLSLVLKDSAKNKIASIRTQMSQAGSNMIKVDPTEIQYFYSNAPLCPFNLLINY